MNLSILPITEDSSSNRIARGVLHHQFTTALQEHFDKFKDLLALAKEFNFVPEYME